MSVAIRFRVLAALVGVLVLPTAPPSVSRSVGGAEHVLLVSIDGLRPEFYLDKRWPAPVLQQLAREGVRAEGVRSVFPSVTYPAHTTMITGALPARHGVYYNTPFEPEGETGRWYWEEAAIQVPTLWDAARAADMTTASFMWPVSVGAPIDWNVPEVWSLDDGYGAMGAIRDAVQPPELTAELEAEAVGRLTDTDIGADWYGREMRTAMMAAWVIERHRPDLVTVHLVAADHFQHDDGRDSARVRRAVAAVDAALGMILDAYDRTGLRDRTAVVITGDHGFHDIHTILAPNVWLVRAGLMEEADDRGDWRATFHTSSASAFLHLADPADEEAAARVRRLLAERPAAERALFRVVEREELDAIGADPRAILALAPLPGVSMSSSGREPLLRGGSGGNHGFFPDTDAMRTGFVAAGAGVAADVTVPMMGLEQVAPLIARLLNLDLELVDGALLPGLLARD